MCILQLQLKIRKLPPNTKTSWKQQENPKTESRLVVGGRWEMTTVGTGFPFGGNILELDSGGDCAAL